jgi:hypothetical protein
MLKNAAEMVEQARDYATAWNKMIFGDLPEGLDIGTMSNWPPDLIQDLSLRIGVFEDFKIHFLFPNTSEEERRALCKLARNRFSLVLSRNFNLLNIEENRRDFEDSVQGIRAWDLDKLTEAQNEILSSHYLVNPLGQT